MESLAHIKKGSKNENYRVASPEYVPIHHNDVGSTLKRKKITCILASNAKGVYEDSD